MILITNFQIVTWGPLKKRAHFVNHGKNARRHNTLIFEKMCTIDPMREFREIER